MKRDLVMLCAVLLLWALPAAAANTPSANTFSNWAAIVVAGDWHSHSGAPSEVFDNARRDVSAGFERIGVSPDNLIQFSVRPDRYPEAHPLQADADTVANSLWDLSNRASGGCLIYFSSHGSPDGIVLGGSILTPPMLEAMLHNSCAGRPTVVILSACFSGAFVPALAGPNRLILTAARWDRTSFGCGDNDKYPFFDDCVLKSLPRATDFPQLAQDVDDCVARREQAVHVDRPSDPQLSVGVRVLAALPHWRVQ